MLSLRSPKITYAFLLAGVIGASCAVGGCIWAHERRKPLDLGVGPGDNPLAHSAAYRDTIGALAYYQGLAPMRVRGYGLVVGLGTNGSRDCPQHVLDRLMQSLYKQHHFAEAVVGIDSITPERLIGDEDTAVVVVQGDIPAAAVRGSRFDVVVFAVPGTQTKSLRGGRLYTTALHVYRPVSETAAITGQVLARAGGPIFLNPFSGADSATTVNPRQGIVIGGGVAVQDRRLRLVLVTASYPRARQIQDRINAQFPGARRVANAVSPSLVELDVPEEFRDETSHFLALVRSLYVSRDPKFEATRARELAHELINPTAPHGRIALSLEGLGRAAIPELNELYTHSKDYVSFYAAAAGLRLGEHLAGDVMAKHAADPKSPFRFRAIRALGEARGMGGAAIALRRLLYDEDPRIRIAAYEGLIARDDREIRSRRIDEDNFILDNVPSGGGKDMIYVKRSGSRRIALFGDDLRCTPPIFYRSPDGGVTLTAEPGDERITALRVAITSGAVSDPMPLPLQLQEMIALLGSAAGVDRDGQVVGLGLGYGEVVRMLYRLCQDGSINAEFRLEEPNVAELFGPPRPTGRPESEL